MLRFLALGDSYTIGEGVEPSESWPARLASLLRADGWDLAAPEIIAATGWTTADLDAEIRANAPRAPYDLVSLLIGVNNQYQDRPLAEFQQQFRHLLGQALDFAGGEPMRVVVLSIPDWGVTPFAAGRDRARISQEINAFNRACFAEVVSSMAHFIDVTSDSRDHPDDVAPDGLHPSPATYERWAALAVRAARVALELPAAA